MGGSSPLTRGKQKLELAFKKRGRLIPAHAGKTWRRESADAPHRAHPRSRGENVSAGTSLSSMMGSSPLTRGKPSPPDRWSSARRLIPAHAGKTLTTCPTTPETWAHPRSRGENRCPQRGRSSPRGSSPLTRGKRRPRRGHVDSGGLIPAHAGKTWGLSPAWPDHRAHPRSRGENRAA